MSQQISVELTEEELKEIQTDKAQTVEEKVKQVALMFYYFENSFRGRKPGEREPIDKLVNLDNIVERSRFPTYPILREQVYCRLVAFLNPNYKSYEKYADLMAQALIEYKGEGRTEWIEGLKRQAPTEAQQFYIGGMAKSETQAPPKRRFWQRKPKEESEFQEQ